MDYLRPNMRCIPPVRDSHRVVGRVCEIPMLFIGIAVRLRCSHPIVWRRVREALQALRPAKKQWIRPG